MAYDNFKKAYFENDPVAKEIGQQIDVAFQALVDQGLIQDFSSVWWSMCAVAYKSHIKKYYNWHLT